MHDAVELEGAGVPTAVIVTEAFLHEAQVQRAALGMVQELSANYVHVDGAPGSGLLKHAVYHKPHGVGVDESCIWGDYFYLEALVRLTRTWQPYW